MSPSPKRRRLSVLVSLAIAAPSLVACGTAPGKGAHAAVESAGPVIGRWHQGDFDALVARLGPAETLVMEVGADWCGPCNQLAWEVLDTERSATLLASSAGLRVDFETPDGQALAGRFGVINLPTTVVVGNDGKERGRVEGYDTADAYVDAVLEAAAHPGDLAVLVAAAAAHPEDPEARLDAARARLFAGFETEALPALSAIVDDLAVPEPIRAEAARIHGRWLLRVRHDPVAAVAHFERMAALFAGAPKLVAHFTYWTATALAAGGQRVEAEGLISGWVAASPEPVLPTSYALEFFVHNKYPPDLCARTLDRLVALDGWDADRRYTEARILKASGDAAAARRAIAEAQALEPDNALYRNYAARLVGL